MASSYGGRDLRETPTWAIAGVCLVMVIISIAIEYVLHLVGKWLTRRHKRALHEALEKFKAELMLLGFISLLLTVGQSLITEICVPLSVGNSWHPCRLGDEGATPPSNDKCGREGKVPIMSYDGLNQLHYFIFVLAVVHVLYCISTMVLGRLKMRKWKKWERETKTVEYQFSHDPERFRFARETSFGRRHLNFWSQSTILIWIVSFVRQFFTSIQKVDYLTLRHGFIMAHLAPQSANVFDFQKYIERSLDEDFTVVVGISPIIWFFALMFLLFTTHGTYSYLWLPFIPLIIILVVGTKLQVIITRMGLQIQERGDVIKGVPLVQPDDNLFWFNRPRLILHIIHFVLFQNAFQLAFFIYSWYEFGLRSCFHRRLEDVIIRISMGVLIQFICSYVTLPLYALVTQMGSNMKPTIFNERVAVALKKWHHTAKKHIKESRRSGTVTPLSSRPGTPTHGQSPVHLLRHYRNEVDSPPASPRFSDNERSESPSPVHHSSSHGHWNQAVAEQEREMQNPSQHEIRIHSTDFSFDKRSRKEIMASLPNPFMK